MNVQTLVNVGEVETTVHITHAEIANAIFETAYPEEAITLTLNRMANYLNSIPRECVEKMKPEQRAACLKFFADQAKRFDQ